MSGWVPELCGQTVRWTAPSNCANHGHALARAGYIVVSGSHPGEVWVLYGCGCKRWVEAW